MTKQERQAVTAALCRLATATGGQELDPARIVVYLQQLDADPAEELLAALARLTRRARFFPAVGEIVAEMEAARENPAEQAWRTATVLSRSDPDAIQAAYCKDPRLRVAVRSLGGMATIRNRAQRDDETLRRRFADAYQRTNLDLPRTALESRGATMALRSSETPMLDRSIKPDHVPCIPGDGDNRTT